MKKKGLLVLVILAVCAPLVLWVGFVIKPYLVASKNGAELLTSDIWPVGVVRYPCINGDHVVFPDDVMNDGYGFISVNNKKISLRMHLNYVSGIAYCNNNVKENSAVVAWGKYDEKYNYQPYVSINYIDDVGEHITVSYDLPREMTNALLGNGKKNVGLF